MSASVQVMVEMDAPPAAVIYAEALKVAQASAASQPNTRVPMSAARKGDLPKVEIDSTSAARVSNHVTTLDAAQKSLLPAIANAGGKVIFRTQRAFNGIAVSVSPDRIAELAKLPGVKNVRPMKPKYQTAFSDIDFLGARSFWNKPFSEGVGIHGEGVKIAVIDSGLDYVHANFGGPGTSPAAQGITDQGPVPNAFFPSQKVPFGRDFAGDEYDGSNEPTPDDNPLDSDNGHGTSCASLAAGFGTNAGGTTYRGNYDSGTPIVSMRISPGFAPLAQLVPLRVFGRTGSTNLVTQAIDFAIDPNGDGNFNDRVDIISMSLGSPIGDADDDSAIASSNAVAAGVIVSASAGNSGDSYYITGSPSTGVGVISVAASFNSQGGFISNLEILVNRPASLQGSRFFAIYGAQSPRAANDTTRDVVAARSNDANPGQGCSAFANAEQVAGKIALIDRGTCAFSQKILNAEAAGAIGVIVVNSVSGDPITMSVPGTNIPSAMISKSDGDSFKASAVFDPVTGVAANGANVTVFNKNVVMERPGTLADVTTSYTSRGPSLDSTALKPDLTAPAEVVGVATSLSGTDVNLFNGTSSACPHVSGSLALLRQLHPTWSVEEIQALMMNTATNNVFTSSSRTTRLAVARMGTGRVDLNKASNGNVVIFNATDRNRVNMSFGNVEVPVDGTVGISKEMTIRNKGNSAVTYNVSFDGVSTVGDASFSAPFTSVTVNAGQERTFPVLFRATGSSLRHTRDPGTFNGQNTDFGVLGRQWLSESAGYGVFTPTSGNEPVIRVALYAAPKPVGAMRTLQQSVTPSTNASRFDLKLTGRPINTGGTSTDIIGLAKVFECQYVGQNAGDPSFSTNPNLLRYVGVTSDYSTVPAGQKQNTTLTWALEGFGDSTIPSAFDSDKEILIDTNFDGEADFVLFGVSIPSGRDQTNAYFSRLIDLNTGLGAPEEFNGYQYYTNGFPGSSRDTNAYNNSVIMLSADASSLGFTGAGQSNFQYRVVTFDRNGQLADVTPYLFFDVARPGLDGANGGFEPTGTYYADQPNTTVSVNYNGFRFQKNKSKGILVVHQHNGRGDRTELITINTPKISNFNPRQGPVGTTVTITGSKFQGGTDVRFSPNVPANNIRIISNNTITCKVPSGAVTGPITVSNSAGSDRSQGKFTVTP